MTHLELKLLYVATLLTLQASLESFPRELQDSLLPASNNREMLDKERFRWSLLVFRREQYKALVRSVVDLRSISLPP
jgi:hypothetical protein